MQSFQLNPEDVDGVAAYIANQREYHHRPSYTDECRELFARKRMEYAWD